MSKYTIFKLDPDKHTCIKRSDELELHVHRVYSKVLKDTVIIKTDKALEKEMLKHFKKLIPDKPDQWQNMVDITKGQLIKHGEFKLKDHLYKVNA